MKLDFKKKYIQSYIYNQGFDDYTSIQRKIIPLILKNKNLIGVSQAGTGKTLSFLLPIFDSIDPTKNYIQAAIIVPTRELARQIYSESLKLKKYENNISIQYIIGGENSNKKITDLKKNQCHLLITTSEKFLEITNKYKNIFSKLKLIVFDEADMLIDLGFINSFVKIIEKIPNSCQKLAFSATLHDMLANKIRIMFGRCEIINVSESIWINKKIKHFLIHFSSEKEEVFKNLVSSINPYFCIIFANTKKEVESISMLLNEMNMPHRVLHGDMEARKRKNVYREIKSNHFEFLVSTDIASRGIDIDGASHIISWNLPKDDVWYIHRSGRTGRSKYEGQSYIFFDKSEIPIINRLLKKGVILNNLKFKNNDFLPFDYKFKQPKKRQKNTDVDKQIRNVINTASKKIKPNYKKKIKLQINKIKQKEKRKKIDANMKQALIKKYKIENAKKTRGE